MAKLFELWGTAKIKNAKKYPWVIVISTGVGLDSISIRHLKTFLSVEYILLIIIEPSNFSHRRFLENICHSTFIITGWKKCAG